MSEEEVEYEINARVAEMARQMHHQEKHAFEQLQAQLGKLECHNKV